MKRILLTMATVAVIAIGVGAISSPASAFLDVDCRGHSCNDNSVDNSNAGGSATQGQQQGIFGSGNSSSKSSVKNSGNSSQSQFGINKQSQSNDGNSSNNSVTVEGDNFEAADIPVSSAHAAALTSADDTCMGSTSAGFQGMSFGISFGSTWRDEDCVRRKDARMFYNMKMTNVALARMCQKDDNRAAVEATGIKCPGATSETAAITKETIKVSAVTKTNDWTYLDQRRGGGN